MYNIELFCLPNLTKYSGNTAYIKSSIKQDTTYKMIQGDNIWGGIERRHQVNWKIWCKLHWDIFPFPSSCLFQKHLRITANLSYVSIIVIIISARIYIMNLSTILSFSCHLYVATRSTKLRLVELQNALKI